VITTAACIYAKMPARCGSVSVPENRSAPGGRAIRIHFVVLPAQGGTPKEPIFGIAGGPGQSAIDAFESYVPGPSALAAAHATHDIVLVDQRGTGRSNPLNCDIYPTDDSTYTYLFPPATLRACRARLAVTNDLNAYGSGAAADDLNDVRRQLGYAKIVLFGGSYGTTESLIYMRRHGDTVRAALLEGVAPPWMRLPLPFPRGAQRALADLERSCASDRICSTNFPHFAPEFDTLVARSKHGGIPVAGGHAISFEVFADRMRQTMYDSFGASYLPYIVHRAALGDTEPLATLVAAVSHGIPGSLAMGMNLSVTCAESMPFITDEEARKASRGAFMGDSRYRAQRKACDMWNVTAVDHSFLDPIRSDVPVLMVNGADDPATPPQFGAQELAYLPNGRQLLVPDAGHDFSTPCSDTIEQQFLATYSVRDLPTSCLRAVARPPFATSLKGLF
jgi:pimeloyl-ACP methyl ester carboxylesterase